MHIKRVELAHFKSFGGTASVPLLTGFTVISGPNGSGKSNILDALLFALGLASSKGMRADRLPDLVNQNQLSRRSTAEASVTVTFDISDVPAEMLLHEGASGAEAAGNAKTATSATQGEVAEGESADHGAETPDSNVVPLPTGPREWSVTRRLRVTSQGTYTSNYYINGTPCTLTQLHEQLQRFHVYPEGYNVVLQGDVTSIISMNARERREIIDELAGVASFDRKIEQACEKLEVVKDREERFRIVEKELIAQRDRLAQDRLKAEKYQRLKAELHTHTQWEAVQIWRGQQRQVESLRQQIQGDGQAIAQMEQQLQVLGETLQTTQQELDALNARVKALGEDEHLALQSKLATQEAELRQLQRQTEALSQDGETTASQLRQAQVALQEQQQTLASLDDEIQILQGGELTALRQAEAAAQTALAEKREATSAIASASQAWIDEQRQLRRAIEDLLNQLEPQRSEQVRLQERVSQLTQQIDSLSEALATLTAEAASTSEAQTQAEAQRQEAEARVQALAQSVAEAEQALQVQQQTQQRLLQEHRQKQRELDRLEAQTQAMQESQGTQATKLLLESGLPGICGLVAQLGRVDPKFQLALEIAAGGRLGHLVVEDDQVAARGIDLLKRRQAGRATFLPLNAIRVPRFDPIPEWKRPDGLIDYAVNLIDCDDRYRRVFAFVFGSTAVFESLAAARSQLGKLRMVTLDGDLLETSGAMTGGSTHKRQGRLHFGTVTMDESEEAIALRQRLSEIDTILARCEQRLEAARTALETATRDLAEAQQQQREAQLQAEQTQKTQQQQQQQQQQSETRLAQYRQELIEAQTRFSQLAESVPALEANLQTQRDALTELEQSQTHSEWQQAQAEVQALEQALSDRQATLQAAERRLQDFQTRRERLLATQQQTQAQIAAYQQQQIQQDQRRQSLEAEQQALEQAIAQTRQALAALEQRLAAEKAERDRVEYQLREQQTQQQQQQWQRQQRLASRQERQQQLAQQEDALAAAAAELPDPLPAVPPEMDLDAIRKRMRSLQQRLEALEPVNMLALEEYNHTQERLQELSQKLTTLEEERTELLLRIENFTTLRHQAFQEAFEAVNENFKAIFAQLSEGDGYLQLDDPQNPFNGGLNLVAHPKGKPVRRLASMSGGEKSLTALSFIFALQRYRPSPFYAFDEVDMFLDGANVERLSKMIKQQAQQAQFIVVSLRRPMIEAAQRTIGVTQARGAYTQVLGIDLEPKSASM